MKDYRNQQPRDYYEKRARSNLKFQPNVGITNQYADDDDQDELKPKYDSEDDYNDNFNQPGQAYSDDENADELRTLKGKLQDNCIIYYLNFIVQSYDPRGSGRPQEEPGQVLIRVQLQKILFLLSWISYFSVNVPILNVAGFISGLSMLFAIFGFIITNKQLATLIFRFEKGFIMSTKLKVQNSIDNILQGDFTKQFILSFLTFALFIVFMSLGILAVGLIDSQLAYIKGDLYQYKVGQDPDKSFTTIETEIEHMLGKWISIIKWDGILSIILSVICLAISMNSFAISKREELYHLSNQFMSVLQVGLSCGVLVLIQTTKKYFDLYEVKDNVRQWPMDTTFTFTSILIVSYIGLWLAVIKDKIDIMRMIGSMQTILFLIIFIFTCFMTHDIKAYTKDFECYQTMALIHQDQFTEFSCKDKYRAYSKFPNTLINKDECPIEAVRVAWEDRVLAGAIQDENGCLNKFCCDSLLQFTKSKFDYAIYFAYLTSVLGFVNYITLVSLITFLQIYTIKRLEHNIFEKLLGVIMILMAVLAAAYMIFGVPQGPSQMTVLEPVAVEGLQGGVIDSRYKQFDGYFSIFDISIKEDREPCGLLCSDLSYLITLSVNKGYLRFSPGFDEKSVEVISNQRMRTGYYLQYRGDLLNVNRALELFEYHPSCPFDLDNELTVTIKASPINGKGTGQIVSADMGEGTEISGAGEFTVLDKSLKYNFASGKEATLSGRLVYQKDDKTFAPVPKAKVIVDSTLFVYFYLNLQVCDQWSLADISTDFNGLFEFKVPQIEGSRPYTLSILFQSVESDQMKTQKVTKEIVIGGIKRGTDFSMGTVVTFDDAQTYRDENVEVQVIDGKRMKVVKDADLTVTMGSDPNVALEWSPSLRNEVSDKYGKFKFLRLKQNVYSFYANKEGYFEDSFAIPVVGKLTAMPVPILHLLPEIEEGNVWIRMKLNELYQTQTNSTLLLHLDFQVSDNQTCQISPFMRSCGGANLYGRMDTENTSINFNSQSILIDKFGNYTYLLSVRALILDQNIDYIFNRLQPQVDIISGNQTDNQEYNFFYPPQKPYISEYVSWVIGCFSGQHGIQQFKTVNKLAKEDLLNPKDYC